MVRKSVFTVIYVCKTKIAKIGAKKFWDQFFKFWVGEKKGENQNFSKILGGNQSLTHYGTQTKEVTSSVVYYSLN